MILPLLSSSFSPIIIYYVGNGVDTFDPVFTTSKSCTITLYPDDSSPITSVSGTNHSFSYTPSAGNRSCKVKCSAGYGAITAINASTDRVTGLRGGGKLINCVTCDFSSEAAGSIPVSQLPIGCQVITLTNNYKSGAYDIYDYVSNLPNRVWTLLAAGYAYFHIDFLSVPAVCTSITLRRCHPVGNVGLLPCKSIIQTLLLREWRWDYGSIANEFDPAVGWDQCVSLRSGSIYSESWAGASQAQIDAILSSMWAARAAYTYATPAIDVSGSKNAAPSGSYVAPIEGADWHLDVKWIPLTGKAMIYDLVNDVNAEGFNKWTITYTA